MFCCSFYDNIDPEREMPMKKLVSFLLILALCPALFACGGSPAPAALPTPESRDPQEALPAASPAVSTPEISVPEEGNANLTAQKLLSDPERYAGRKVTVEGFVSSKVNMVSQDGRSWSYYQISVVDDRKYVEGNVLKIQTGVTPTYYQSKWLKEEENLVKSDYGLVFTVSAADYELVSPGYRIVLSGYAWTEGDRPVLEDTYGNYHASHYLSSGKILEILSMK